MTEAELTRKIVKELNKLPFCFAAKIHGGPHQRAGLPDIVGCYRGHFFGFEVKLPGKENKVTMIQATVLKRIEQAEGRARLITSVEQAMRGLGIHHGG